MVLVSYPLAVRSPSILTFPPDTSKSRQALQSAEKALSKVEKDKKDADEQLAKLSDPADGWTRVHRQRMMRRETVQSGAEEQRDNMIEKRQVDSLGFAN